MRQLKELKKARRNPRSISRNTSGNKDHAFEDAGGHRPLPELDRSSHTHDNIMGNVDGHTLETHEDHDHDDIPFESDADVTASDGVGASDHTKTAGGLATGDTSAIIEAGHNAISH